MKPVILIIYFIVAVSRLKPDTLYETAFSFFIDQTGQPWPAAGLKPETYFGQVQA
jgi:hypothetical protein